MLHTDTVARLIMLCVASLCVLLASVGRTEPGLPEDGAAHPEYPGALDATRAALERQHRQMDAIFASSDRKRLDIFRSLLVEDLPVGADRERLEKLDLDHLSDDDIKFLIEIKSRGGFVGRHARMLLVALSRMDQSLGVREKIASAFDVDYTDVIKLRNVTDPTDIGARETRWSEVIEAIGIAGSAGLFTDAFWSALEAEGFRGGHVLTTYATDDVARRLRRYETTKVWEEPRLRDRIQFLLKRVEVARQFPEIGRLHPRYASSILEDILQTQPERRKVQLERRLNDIRAASTRPGG